MGGGTQPFLPLAVLPLALVPVALPSSEVDGQLRMVRPRAQPRRRTGRCNIPRAPSSFGDVAPTHPELLQGVHPAPFSTMLARATSPCLLVVSSPTPTHTPSIPLHLMMELFFLPGEGTPIHSMREDFFFPRGSARNASTDHIVLAGIINIALPINLLDGLRWGGVFIVLVLSFGRFLPFFPLVFLS